MRLLKTHDVSKFGQKKESDVRVAPPNAKNFRVDFLGNCATHGDQIWWAGRGRLRLPKSGARAPSWRAAPSGGKNKLFDRGKRQSFAREIHKRFLDADFSLG